MHHFVTIATIVLAAALAGCAASPVGPASQTPRPTATPTAPTSPSGQPSADASRAAFSVPASELLFDGQLLICSDLPYPPQEFFDSEGNPTGSDIDIGVEIAHRLGLEARIVNSVFDTILDALLAGKCDIVISAQTITAERLEIVDMIPYFQAGQTFLVQHGNPAGIHTELDLCERSVAAQSGTILAQLIDGTGEYRNRGLSDSCREAGKPRIDLVELAKDDEAIAALIAGEVDAYFVDSPAAGYHVLQNMNMLELSSLTLDVAEQGISVPKDKPRLRSAIRDALDSMMDDGTYVAILARYGVQDGSVAQAPSP